MADSMETSNPLPARPAEATYRVMRKDREKDRQRRFDSLFQEPEEGKNEASGSGKQEEQGGGTELKDTFEREESGEKKAEAEKLPSDTDNEDQSASDRGHLVDVTV